MKEYTRLIVIPIIILFLFSNVSYNAFAMEGEVGYSVQAIQPENQINKTASYFDLMMEPGQEQTILINIYNTSNEDIEVAVHITNPITNRNGIIDYTNLEAEADESLKVPITEIASIEENDIKIHANSTTQVPIHLIMPAEEFDGIILGGIYVEKIPEESEEKEESVQIQNRYSYVIGLQLRENDTVVKPDLLLKEVNPELVNYRTSVIAKIQNRAPIIADHLNIQAKVFDSDDKEIRFAGVENYRLAPNITMDFVIDWENKLLEPGTYKVSMYVNNGDESWVWNEEFIIPEEEAILLNEEAVEIEKDYTGMIVGGFSGVIALLLMIIFRLGYKIRHVRQTSEDDQES